MWLILVILIKDSASKVGIEVKKVSERDKNSLFAIDDGNFGLSFVFVESVFVEILYEIGKFLSDFFSD